MSRAETEGLTGSVPIEDERYMRRALELAARGLNTTDPNPRVGCVLVNSGRIVGEGWHERAGAAHAEVNALRVRRRRCAGRYGLCHARAVRAHRAHAAMCRGIGGGAGAARRTTRAADPNPLINGAGVAALRSRGIEVIGELLPEESRALNPGFFKRMQSGLPWVRVKLAMSLDGRTALANGASRWITGETARADVQRYRARSSVILTGSGTVLSDDPALDVRLPGTVRQPLRVILDGALRVPAQARVFARPTEAAGIHREHGCDAARRARGRWDQRGARGLIARRPLARTDSAPPRPARGQ